MRNSSVNKFLAAVVASGLVIASCGGDDDASDQSVDDAIGGEEAPAEIEGDADVSTRNDDAEDFLIDEPSDDANGNDREAGEDSEVTAQTVTPSADADGDAHSPAQDELSADAEEQLVDEGAESGETSDTGTGTGTGTDADPGTQGGLFEPETDAEDPESESFQDSRFEDYGYRDFIPTRRDALSTFALDVDTGAFTIGRRSINSGSLPPRESVRPEEYINAFDYDYRAPQSGLDVSVDGGPSPFDNRNHLVRVGVQAEIVDDDDRGPAALTFVIDTSGSMDRPDRLGLVKESLITLIDQLDRTGNGDDTVAIVTYSDDSGIVLNPTPISDKSEIIDAIEDLGPGGSTNLEAGLREGYDLAREAFQRDGINRVILASDGVANSGQTDPDALAALIRDDADRGINLVTVGYGMGDFNDITMEQLADQGDGFYAYVDTEDEAERLFEDELTSTLLTVAKDAKIQVEFDSEFVEAYRLIGFENRGVRDSDFRNDDVDAGELGAGHQVTAIYEIELESRVTLDDTAEIATISLRWEDPDNGDVIEIDEDIDLRDIEQRWANTTDDFQLATVVATLAEKLRDNPYADAVDLDDLAIEASRLADTYDSDDADGADSVDELADLVARVADLS